MELDNQTLDAILSGSSPYLEQHCDGARWLMLVNFTFSSDDVLERLVTGTQNLEGIEIGLNQLSPRAAKALLGMNVDFLFLTGLHDLDEQAAFVLGACPFEARPIRHLRLEEPISERAASWLVGASPPDDHCDSPLTVSIPSITLPVAQALSRHTHELCLEVRDGSLSPEVAAILSGHAGYSLTLDCDCGFSDETLQALAGNSGKRTRKMGQQNRVYVVDHDMWSSHYENDRFLCELH